MCGSRGLGCDLLPVAGPLGAQGRQKAAESRQQMSPPHPAQRGHLRSTRTLPSRSHPRPRAHRRSPSRTCSDVFTDIASSRTAKHSAPPTPNLSPWPRAGNPPWSQTHRRALVHTHTHTPLESLTWLPCRGHCQDLVKSPHPPSSPMDPSGQAHGAFWGSGFASARDSGP